MTVEIHKTLSGHSLRARYLSLAGVVGLFLIGGSITASLYVNSVTSGNADALQMRDEVTRSISKIRGSTWQVDTALNALLIKPNPQYLDTIGNNMNVVEEELQHLIALKAGMPEELSTQIVDLRTHYGVLHERIQKLLELREDPEWVYPMLPFINEILLESNTQFTTAIGVALYEIETTDGSRYGSPLYRQVDELKDLWQEVILNFRAVIIRFAGLNALERIPQENNIVILSSHIQTQLDELDRLKDQGDIGFETEIALDTLRSSSQKWYADYQELKKIRDSNLWRADLRYLEVNIRPVQDSVFSDLTQIAERVEGWSASNVNAVEYVANQINMGLWGLSALALSFVLLVYLMIDRYVLTPVNRIASAISTEGRNIEHMSLPEKGSQEISALINAFNAMRSQIHQRQLALEHQAMHDALTGLPNRALLQDRLEQAIHRGHRQNSGMMLMLLDLDHFKEINDTLGHPVGDQVLQKVGQRLAEYLRETDTVARLGGDEFAIIAPEVDGDYATALVEKVVMAVNQVIQVENQNLYVGASVGVAHYPEHGEDVATLIRHVDIAMYHAKRNNKDYVIYDPVLNEHSVDNLSLLGDLRTELKQQTGQLQLYYQPQLDLFTREVLGAEALLRWEHPRQGFVSPEQIVRMAEQTGLIGELTQWVLERAISDCAGWQKERINVGVAVNLSALDLQDPRLPGQIRTLLDRYGLKAHNLTVEITESAVMSDPVHARQVLQKLNQMGLDLWIDDYGTGFSSLAYLKLLPVNGLKIDKSFVMEMQQDENDAIIVHSTIDLAHNLGLQVIAEGVESLEVSLWLRQNKCDSAQGYFFARPMPEMAFRDWLQSYQTKAVL